MLGRLFRRKKPRVFLGTIAVSARTDLKRHLEQDAAFEGAPLQGELHRSLTQIFSLPPAQSVADPLPTDLVVDVWISKFQLGEMLDVDLVDAGVTLFWRPKVSVSSRLYSLTTRKTKATFLVTEKMKWLQFFGRMFSWRGFFQGQPFLPADMEYLLCQACARLLAKMQKVV